MKSYQIILASQSPRRRELLAGLGLDFTATVVSGVDETYPDNLPAASVPEYIAQKKATGYAVKDNELLITADTLVRADTEILGKPKNADEARRMLQLLSGRSHQVTTGVCMKTVSKEVHFSVTSEVTFKRLTTDEIDYYVTRYKPFDKAGAYGIQEWIGYIGVTSLHGSYYNVMGLPVQRIYQELINTFGVKFEVAQP